MTRVTQNSDFFLIRTFFGQNHNPTVRNIPKPDSTSFLLIPYMKQTEGDDLRIRPDFFSTFDNPDLVLRHHFLVWYFSVFRSYSISAPSRRRNPGHDLVYCQAYFKEYSVKN